MKPTKFLTLLMPTVIAWSFVYVAVRLIVGNGGSIPVATNTVLVTLPAIAVLILVFSWPVLRYSKALKNYSGQ
jgi:membrane protein DedA with SNARE-associated domain